MMPDLRRLMQWLMVLAVLVGGLGVGTLRADSVVQPAPMSLESGVSPSAGAEFATTPVPPRIINMNDTLNRAERARSNWIRGILFPMDHNAHAKAWRKFQEDVQILQAQNPDDLRIYNHLERIQITAGNIAAVYEQGWTSDWSVVSGGKLQIFATTENDRGREVTRLVGELANIQKEFAR